MVGTNAMVSKTRHKACGAYNLGEETGNNERITNKNKIIVAINVTKKKRDAVRVYN